MTTHNQQVGAWGEEKAVAWLTNNGYETLRRNVRTPYGEIDVVAQKGGVVFFVEVKTLTSSKEFFPEQQITVRKLEHMLNCAAHYAAEHGIERWQIDVIAVERRGAAQPRILHFENVQ
ncbi:MAG: YraN family protein [Anaerolineales bacterium]|nr:YraN family protein [Anaerolineales bacterium]